MKRLIFAFLILASTATFAHGPHGYWRHGGDNRWYWLAPVIVGGAVTYEMTRPQQPIIVQQTTPPMVMQQQNCSPWTQIQNPDGTMTYTRTCNQ